MKVIEEANKIERHIRARGLKPGDRYMTTAEVGEMMSMSLVTAQRAMGLLAKRNILERRRRAGTFIGKGLEAEQESLNIHFFLPEESHTDDKRQANYWEQIGGIRSVLGQISAHFHFVPNQNINYVQGIVQKTSDANLMNGAILILPSREMRAYFDQSGIPTIVEGGIEADLNNLCWMQWDQIQVGRLLAGWLLERNHRHIATIMRDTWSIGEHLLHDGINEAFSEAYLPSNSMRMRSAPSAKSALMEMARDLFRKKNPPTGFICRNEFQADCVAEAAREAGFEEQTDITHCNAPSASEKNRYTCAMPEISTFEFGKIAGEMLHSLITGSPLASRGRLIPVRLQTPSTL